MSPTHQSLPEERTTPPGWACGYEGHSSLSPRMFPPPPAANAATMGLPALLRQGRSVTDPSIAAGRKDDASRSGLRLRRAFFAFAKDVSTSTRSERCHDGPAIRSFRERESEEWSGWRDSNPRPPAPHAGALPDCATARRFPRTGRQSSSRPGRWQARKNRRLAGLVPGLENHERTRLDTNRDKGGGADVVPGFLMTFRSNPSSVALGVVRVPSLAFVVPKG